MAKINEIKFAIEYMTENMPDTEAYNELDSHIFTDPEWLVFKASIEALEKQIPQKPILEADGYYNGELVYDTWYCPSCNADYDTEHERHDYCPKCGQAIDWSEVDE